MREIERRSLTAVLTLLEEGTHYGTDIHHNSRVQNSANYCNH